MLQNPEIAQALKELDRVETTTVGHLVAFMHTFNLRFGPATNAEQKAVYHELYPVMKNDRDRLVGRPDAQAKPDAAPAPSTSPANPTEIFRGIEDRHLDDSPGGH
jgi:hypothetical protein